MFEYQTAISELTALPVANASVYEGPSAVAAAGYLAKLHNGGKRFVVSAGLHPHSIETLRTQAHGYGMEVVEVPLRDGVTDPDAWAAGDRRRHERGDLRPAELLRRGRGRGGAERRREVGRLLGADGAARRRRLGASRRRSSSPRSTRSRSASSRHPASAAWTWPSARASRSATASTSVGPPSASSRRARSICAGCPAGSRGRPRT